MKGGVYRMLTLVSGKEDYTTGKITRHPFGEKQAIEADATLGAKYPTTYLQPLKGWGIWVKNKGSKRIILQDDA